MLCPFILFSCHVTVSERPDVSRTHICFFPIAQKYINTLQKSAHPPVFGCVSSMHVPTSLLTGVWVQVGEPWEHCRRVLLEVTWENWCPGSRTSCAEAPVLWPPPYRSRLDRSQLGPVTPSDRNLSGDGGGDGGQGLWPQRLGRLMRGRGSAGKRAASEVFSWQPPRTRASISLQLSSPSKDGWSEGKGLGRWKRRGWRQRERERGENKTTNKQTDVGEITQEYYIHKVYPEKWQEGNENGIWVKNTSAEDLPAQSTNTTI